MSETEGRVDLHVHTNFSDGDMKPEQMVAEAQKMGLAGIAITDHDEIGGVEVAIEAAGSSGLEDNLHFLSCPFDVDPAYRRVGRLTVQTPIDEAADLLILDEELAVVALGGKPAAFPAYSNACPETYGRYLLSHT